MSIECNEEEKIMGQSHILTLTSRRGRFALLSSISYSEDDIMFKLRVVERQGIAYNIAVELLLLFAGHFSLHCGQKLETAHKGPRTPRGIDS